MTEPCTEKDAIAVLKSHQEDIRTDIKTILDILQGNGQNGLKTQVAIHRTYFKLIGLVLAPLVVGLTVRAVWAWIGG